MKYQNEVICSNQDLNFICGTYIFPSMTCIINWTLLSFCWSNFKPTAYLFVSAKEIYVALSIRVNGETYKFQKQCCNWKIDEDVY